MIVSMWWTQKCIHIHSASCNSYLFVNFNQNVRLKHSLYKKRKLLTQKKNICSISLKILKETWRRCRYRDIFPTGSKIFHDRHHEKSRVSLVNKVVVYCGFYSSGISSWKSCIIEEIKTEWTSFLNLNARECHKKVLQPRAANELKRNQTALSE